MGDYYDDDDDAGGVGADIDEIEDSIDDSDDVESEDEDDEEEVVNPDAEEDDDVLPATDIIDLEEGETEPVEREFALLGADQQDEDHRMVQIVPAEERITSDIIQLPEMTEAIGIRISQIENGMPVMPGVNVEGVTNAIEMAQMEFLENKNPLILRRIIQQRGNIVIAEDWEVCKMAHPPRVRYYLAAIKKRESPIDVGAIPSDAVVPTIVPEPAKKRVIVKAKAKAKVKGK